MGKEGVNINLIQTGELKTDDIKSMYDITGEHHEYYKTIVYSFDKYEIDVQLGSNDEFIGVTGVKINKDFVAYEKKRMPLGYHDVDYLYDE